MAFQPLTWPISILLSVLIIISSLISIFHDDAFYRYAYQQNGAYEQLDREMVWLVTENFQTYIDDKEELHFFQEDQAAHLEDVKLLYNKGMIAIRLLVGILILCFFSLGLIEDKKEAIRKIFKNAAIITLGAVILLSVLSLNWNWLFTGFHQLFFTGNWQFHPATLMLKLWGGNFFILASVYFLVKCFTASAFLFLSSTIILRR